MDSTNKDWFEFSRELKRRYSKSTWVPLRAIFKQSSGGSPTSIGYHEDGLFVGSVAFPPEKMEEAEKLGWDDIGLIHSPQPYAYSDGSYKRCEEYQYNEKETIGTHFVFEQYIEPVGKRRWIIDPDIIMSLRLIKENNKWLSADEDFAAVIRETYNDNYEPILFEIKREFFIRLFVSKKFKSPFTYI